MKTSFHCTPTMKTVPLILNIIFEKNLLWKIWKLSECIGFLISMQTKYAHVHTYISSRMMLQKIIQWCFTCLDVPISGKWKVFMLRLALYYILTMSSSSFLWHWYVDMKWCLQSVPVHMHIFEILLPEINTCISTPSSFVNCKPKF